MRNFKRPIPPRDFNNSYLRLAPKGILGVPMEKLNTIAGDLWMPKSDLVMRSFLRTTSVWELELSNIIRDLAKSVSVFIDVGANVGYFTRLIALENSQCQIVAFEPHPLTFSVLDLNTWEFGPRVICWPLALSENVGIMSMQTEANNLGDTHFSPGNSADTLVATTQLDIIYPDLKADLIKIDVQGAELSCIRGMLSLIKRSENVKILVEFWPNRLLEFGQDPATLLSAYNDLKLSIKYLRNGIFISAQNREILEYCAASGPNAQANLLLENIVP